MTKVASIQSVLRAHGRDIHPVVPFDAANDKLYAFDFTAGNKDLHPDQIADTESFAVWIKECLREKGARYGIGGYNEHRTLYARSKHFDADEEPRRLHLGIDIWGPAGTKVMAPMDGIVHSFGFNNNDSDYGATLILTHNIDDIGFHILYGHLSLNSLKNRHEGQHVSKGEVIGEFGMRFENGNWPPHLHMQVILNMEDRKGDYPGVCKFSEKEHWLANSPDPDMVLQMMQYAR